MVFITITVIVLVVILLFGGKLYHKIKNKKFIESMGYELVDSIKTTKLFKLEWSSTLLIPFQIIKKDNKYGLLYVKKSFIHPIYDEIILPDNPNDLELNDMNMWFGELKGIMAGKEKIIRSYFEKQKVKNGYKYTLKYFKEYDVETNTEKEFINGYLE
jgi:hypothetical protein